MKRVQSMAVAGLWLFGIISGRAGTLVENFASDPLQNGWQAFGNTNLFAWNPTNQNLEVTWDSSQPNSYFYHALGTTLTEADDFSVEFDVQLGDLQWTNTYQLAVGLLNLGYATDPNFSRPLGYSPDVFEFDYFPDSGDGYGDPSLAASAIDHTDSITNFPHFYFIFDVLPMQVGTNYHVKLTHAAAGPPISGEVFTNGQSYSRMPLAYPGPVSRFRLDTLAVSSYDGAGQDPQYAGSILAHGTIDNFVVTLPPVVRNLSGGFSNGVWQAQFGTYTNWQYTLERTTDLSTWHSASPAVAGTGSSMSLCDTNAPPDRAFYRVRGVQP